MTQVLMKACPYCAEDIRAAAVKCKFCGSDLTDGATSIAPKGKGSPRPSKVATAQFAPPSDKVAWGAALSPLIVLLLSPVLYAVVQGLSFEVNVKVVRTLLVMILGLILCYLDEQTLRKTGREPGKMGSSLFAIILGYYVPLYLYLRSKALGQRQKLVASWLLAAFVQFAL